MEQDFLCLACKKLPEKIFECLDCGAPYCTQCCINSKIKCVECSCYEFQVSVFGNMAINEIEIKCPKCKMSTTKKELDSHLKNFCNESELKCNFSDCMRSFKKKDILLHLINNHESKILNFFTGEKINLESLGISSLFEISVSNINLSNFPSYPDFRWFNSSKSYSHTADKMFTFTSTFGKQGYWSAKILVKKSQNAGYVVVGVFNKYYNEWKGYLGGDLGTGNWGIAGNGALGESGSWKKGLTHKEGDIIEIIYNKGKISYNINGAPNIYTFYLGPDAPTYLAATVYYSKTQLIILDN